MSAMDRLSPQQRLGLRNLAASSAMDGVEVPHEDLEVMARHLLGEITEDQMVEQLHALHDERRQRLQRQRSELAAVVEQFAAEGYDISEEVLRVAADFLVGEIGHEELNVRLAALREPGAW